MIARGVLTLTRAVNESLARIPANGTYVETPAEQHRALDALRQARSLIEAEIARRDPPFF